MNSNSVVKKLSEHDEETILHALTERARTGDSFEKVFAREEEMTVDQYWVRRKKFPKVIEGLHDKARLAVREERLDVLTGFAGRQMERAIKLRESAADALAGSIEELGRIVRGENKEVTMKTLNKKGEIVEKTKTIVIYPRDITKAAGMLLEIAQTGVQLFREAERLLLPQNVMPREEEVPPLPAAIANIYFTSVEPIKEEVVDVTGEYLD